MRVRYEVTLCGLLFRIVMFGYICCFAKGEFSNLGALKKAVVAEPIVQCVDGEVFKEYILFCIQSFVLMKETP